MPRWSVHPAAARVQASPPPPRQESRRADRCRRRPTAPAAWPGSPRRRSALYGPHRRGRYSRPSSTFITHTPVSRSPARIARSTGAAPRHRGSSEKCRFTIGTRSSRRAGMIRPYATTTASSTSAAATSSMSWVIADAELGCRRLDRARRGLAAPAAAAVGARSRTARCRARLRRARGGAALRGPGCRGTPGGPPAHRRAAASRQRSEEAARVGFSASITEGCDESSHAGMKS